MMLPRIAVDRPVTTLMVVLVIVILGFVSLSGLAIDLYPDITFPIAFIITDYSGVGPNEIENLVTRPLEQAITTVSNINSVSSNSMMGTSVVIAEFNWGTDMDFATLEMREQIDYYKSFLPDDIGNPMIFKFDPALMPLVYFGVNADMDEAAIRNFVEDNVGDRLQRLEGVASVDLYGGLIREIQITVDQDRLQGYGLSLDNIIQALRMENLNLPGGNILDGSNELTIRTIGEFTSVDDINDIMVNNQQGIMIPLRDIARVVDGYKEVDRYDRLDGRPSIAITAQKQSDYNTVQVADRIMDEMNRIQNENEEIGFEVVFNQADFIKESINNIVRNAVVGALLAVLILFIFLRNLRTTFIIGIAIPVSIISTFMLIHFAGLTLNMMSLGGLALGIGMLVDSSIVVLENIFRYRENGYSRPDAAKQGTAEVGTAVIASTLTTAAVFLPIVYVEGIAAILFRQLAMTVSFSLFAALFISLTLIPMLSSKILKVKKGDERNGKGFIKRILDLSENSLRRLENRYLVVLKKALNYRKLVVIFCVIAFVLSMALVPFIGAEFIPSMDEGMINLNIQLPTGTTLDETDRIMTLMEDRILRIEEIETIFVNVGQSGGGMQFSTDPDKGSMYIRLVDLNRRDRSTDLVAEEIRQITADIPGADISVEPQSSFGGMGGGGSPVSLSIKGSDLNVLGEISDRVVDIVQNVEGTREVESSMDEGRPQLQLKVNREKASRLGLSTSQVASAVRGAVQGEVATRYRVAGEEIDIRVLVDKERISDLNDLRQLPISSPLGYQIPLEELADFNLGEGPVTINRSDQSRVVNVSSQLMGRDLGSVMRDINNELNRLPLPEGYTVEVGGEGEEMVDAFINLIMALGLAIILVYMILASQYESFIHPFTIMFSVPLAFIGVSLGLFITGRTFSVPSLIGVIMLTGIVVNNAIVLIDFINRLRNEGMGRTEAILKAGPIRLRPILMTALTTILALLPLSLGIGEGTEVSAPMATVVIGGLIFSTILTLVLLPVIYSIFDDIGDKVKNIFSRRKNKVIEKEGV